MSAEASRTDGVRLPAGVRNLVLIGLRGCGKSTVGRVLAQRLGWALVDTDERVAAAAGLPIRDIFTREGEAGFREREAAAVQAVCRGAGQVISAGGGAVLDAENRAVLRAAGPCVWLTAPADELYRRIQSDPDSAAQRPALTACGGLDEVRDLLRRRAPLYAGLARHVVDTTGRSAAQVADEILAWLGTAGLAAETGG